MGRVGSPWLTLIRSANRKTQNSRTLRRVGVWGYSTVVRANVFLPPPRVLLNGPPKSGTHLLSDCLSLMPKMMFCGKHFALTEFFTERPGPQDTPPLDMPRLRRYLGRCPQGMFATAHARYHPDFASLIEELGFKQVLLLRDPRDVAVSHSFYLLKDTLHQHHGYYARTLRSNEDRLMASIRGFQPGEGAGETVPSMGKSYGRYLRWLEAPATLAVRFENLVGAGGGGNEARQLGEIQRIGNFVARPLDREEARRIAEGMYGRGGLTFRKGQAGDWRNHFTDDHSEAFKEVAGDLLVRLGYEKDADW